MSDEREDKNLKFLICPNCNGKGRINFRRCPECRGLGMGAILKGKFLYWGKEINILSILISKLKRIVKITINTFLVFLGIIGVLFLGRTIFYLSQEGLSIEEIYEAMFIPTPKFLVWGFVFWLSILGDMYLFYRLEREILLRPKILRGKYVEGESFGEIPLDFSQVWNLKKKAKIEISEGYSKEAIKVLEGAYKWAHKLGHNKVNPIHLLTSLLFQRDIAVILGKLGVKSQGIKERINRALSQETLLERGEGLFISANLKKILFLAYKETEKGRKKEVDPVELFIALAKEPSKAWEILYDLEVDLDKIKNVAIWLDIQRTLRERYRRFRALSVFKPKGEMDRAMIAIATPYLNRFSQDLTMLARSGYLPLCVGREKEIEEIFRIIEGGRQSVILVGFPGVGKTDIINGIAQRMVEEDVPQVLADKRFVSLSISHLVAGASSPGELEERMNIIINEIVRAGNIILVIDNLQNMVGVGTESGQALDISEMLTSVLQKHYFICIATSNPIDYGRYIEPKGNLMGSFQKVNIEEPSTNETIMILEAKSSFIEAQHKVYFSYDAIQEAVKLSQRYIHERYLPEKAIKILQEVAAYTRKRRGKNATVTKEDVAAIISEKTNVPVTEITEEESKKLLNLEEEIHKRLIDQDEAVSMVANALRRSRAELRSTKRPIANLLFLGPTGVGKTELAKTVAEIYFGSEENMIRLDMSEYQEQGSINRMIGAPPAGGQEAQGGVLTEAVRKNPFSLLLLDEIEKAHPNILNLFLQVMEDGRLTDARGVTVDFTNVILIGTSNAGAFFIQDAIKEGKTVEEIKQNLINKELRGSFRPEFLNRFDGVIVFKPLSQENIQKIAKLLLKQVEKRLKEKGISFGATDEAVKELAREGFDPIFGARPLKRVIQEKVDNALARSLLEAKIGRRDAAILEAGGKIRIERAEEL